MTTTCNSSRWPRRCSARSSAPAARHRARPCSGRAEVLQRPECDALDVTEMMRGWPGKLRVPTHHIPGAPTHSPAPGAQTATSNATWLPACAPWASTTPSWGERRGLGARAGRRGLADVGRRPWSVGRHPRPARQALVLRRWVNEDPPGSRGAVKAPLVRLTVRVHHEGRDPYRARQGPGAAPAPIHHLRG